MANRGGATISARTGRRRGPGSVPPPSGVGPTGSRAGAPRAHGRGDGMAEGALGTVGPGAVGTADPRHGTSAPAVAYGPADQSFRYAALALGNGLSGNTRCRCWSVQLK